MTECNVAHQLGDTDKPNKIRVAVLTSVHAPFDTRIFYKECKTLAASGYEVVLIVPHDRDFLSDRVQIRAIPLPKNRRERMVKTVWQVFKAAWHENCDIYHFHDPELIPIGLFLKAKGKKVIYDVHEDVPRDILSKTWIAEPLRRTIAFIFEKIENLASRNLNVVVSSTPFICNRFLRIGCKAITVKNYPLKDELHLPNIDWNAKERAVCYVGGIDKIRGIFEMVQAIGQTDAKLLLGGKFSDVNQQNLATTMEGWANVEALGQLGRNEIAQVLSRAMAGLVVLHPLENYLDALPVKMFEYMSAGIPIIASNFPLWKEIVEGNQCGICVDPMNPGEIAGAIQLILDNPDEAKRMGENGRQAVEEKYNWQPEGEVLLKTYEDLL